MPTMQRSNAPAEPSVKDLFSGETHIPVTTENGVIVPTEKKSKPVNDELDEISAEDLIDLEIPDLKYHIVDLLPQGLTVFSAPPKYRKSFTILDAAIEICRGGTFLGHKANKTGVIYFDLESNYRRPKERLIKILNGSEKPKNLIFVTRENRKTHKPNKIKRIGQGFEEQLLAKLEKHPEAGIVIIDVYGKIRPRPIKGADSKQNDDEAFEPLVDICTRRNVSIIVLTHDRKTKDNTDFLANISGSFGIAGSADTIWSIIKSRNEEEATLAITGRDVPPQELAIKFNEKSMKWEFQGNAADVAEQKKLTEFKNSPIKAVIESLLNQSGGEYTGTPADLIKASEYLNNGNYYITQDATRVAGFITSNMHLFSFNGVEIEKGKRTAKGTPYKFTRNKKE